VPKRGQAQRCWRQSSSISSTYGGSLVVAVTEARTWMAWEVLIACAPSLRGAFAVMRTRAPGTISPAQSRAGVWASTCGPTAGGGWRVVKGLLGRQQLRIRARPPCPLANPISPIRSRPPAPPPSSMQAAHLLPRGQLDVSNVRRLNRGGWPLDHGADHKLPQITQQRARRSAGCGWWGCRGCFLAAAAAATRRSLGARACAAGHCDGCRLPVPAEWAVDACVERGGEPLRGCGGNRSGTYAQAASAKPERNWTLCYRSAYCFLIERRL